MYGLSQYLMALQEVEKARLAERARKARQLPPIGRTRLPSRAATMAKKLEGGSDVFSEVNEILIAPDDGAYLPGLDIIHKVTAGAYGGSLLIDEWGLPPGEMIPPHAHAHEDECSYVIRGELMCYVGGDVVLAPAGAYVVKLRGVPHAFYNGGTDAVRVMEILTPGDSFGGYFDEYEEIASRKMGDWEHEKARAELGKRYAITWYDELVPEVRSRFGIG